MIYKLILYYNNELNKEQTIEFVNSLTNDLGCVVVTIFTDCLHVEIPVHNIFAFGYHYREKTLNLKS